MLDGANVEGLEETVLLGKVNMDDETTLLSQIEKALKDVLGRGPCGKGKGAGLDGLVRVEAVKKSEGESCLWVRDQKHKAVKKKAKNKKGADGKVLTCFTCKSEYHFSQDCPKTEGEEARKEKRRKFKKHDSSSEESESCEDMGWQENKNNRLWKETTTTVLLDIRRDSSPITGTLNSTLYAVC